MAGDISRRMAVQGMLTSSLSLCVAGPFAGMAIAAREHPIISAIRKRRRWALGRIKHCKDDPGVGKFRIEMPPDALSVTSDYGAKRLADCRLRPPHLTGGPGRHAGIDMWAPRGTPVIACVDGEIAVSEYRDLQGQWLQIESEHLWPQYWHLDRRFVKVGDKVKRGDIIGTVGGTGKGILRWAPGGAVFLHFAVQEAWNAFVNPHPYWIESDPNLTVAAEFGDKSKEVARVTLYRPSKTYSASVGDHRVLTYPIPGFKDMPYFLSKLEKMQASRR